MEAQKCSFVFYFISYEKLRVAKGAKWKFREKQKTAQREFRIAVF